MLGLMQDRPLLISTLIDHAARYHSDVEIVSRTCEGPTVRTNWRDLSKRIAKLANALKSMGVKPGDRVASLAWNTHRHVELYFAVSGIGAILNTVNPRLFPEQVDYIVNHAENRVLFFDITFSGLVVGLQSKFRTVERYVALTDAGHLPPDVDGVLAYEDLLAPEPDTVEWPVLDERTASALCYTSGTTGNPKGVLYSHRSTLLHSFMVCTADGFRLSSADSVLLVVPLFHVNAWGIPYAAAMCGAKLVLPGPKLDGKSLFDLAAEERCTFSLGVPTVWLGFFQHIDSTPGIDTSALRLERVVVGGSAAPRAIIERFRGLGAFVIHAWGMSETSPVATVGNLLPRHRDLPEKEQVDVQVRQGRVVYGVELKIVDENRNPLPQDGTVAGDLYVRGPWVTSGYFKGVGGNMLDEDGWFPTGDVAKIDADGYVVLTDRSKDVIKSGGEWISSIDLENAAVAHSDVQEAAVIGLPHPKWQERPFLIIVPKPGTAPSREEILGFLSERVAKWWLPDDVAFVPELPHTATGKLQKTKLREQFRDHILPVNQTSHS
ncbi:long-chain-fatty-acid--CoA ligase [Mesorhizobium sp. L-8-3]|uniref:long-chain-fatty-acid--CoA ligase n=1 Tax=Mesorhizobium sp. L-8-3 TaxID=2744522 RepID=UPI001926846B|nr:long-chain-fatty-acid--CoA ligase [Mesorhizobium sp. L-8-3]BCH23878.1 long-chain-fatty-acid--CoA ligase [Mesorhizobium sp. L-8-3]